MIVSRSNPPMSDDAEPGGQRKLRLKLLLLVLVSMLKACPNPASANTPNGDMPADVDPPLLPFTGAVAFARVETDPYSACSEQARILPASDALTKACLLRVVRLVAPEWCIVRQTTSIELNLCLPTHKAIQSLFSF